MKFKILILTCLSFTLLQSPLFAELPGKFDIIVPNVPPAEHSLDKVTIHEVFSFTCGHCYELNKEIKFIEAVFGDKVEIKSIPIGWVGHNPGKLFYIAEEANLGHEVKTRIFDFVFEQNQGEVINKLEILRNVAILEGLKTQFDERMASPEIISKMKAGVRLTKIAKVDSTPTLILENSLKTSRDPKNLFLVINGLLKVPVKEPFVKFMQLQRAAQKKKPVTKSKKKKKKGFWEKVTGVFN